MAKITVGCKLPAGFTIEHKGVTVTLHGAHSSTAILGTGRTVGIDADWFDSWCQEVTPKFAPLASGAIYVFGGRAQAADEAQRLTGFERLNADKPAAGIEPTDETRRELAKARREQEEPEITAPPVE